MKENKEKIKINGVPFEEELEIFGEHKSREQVRAEEKERKRAERIAMQEEMTRRRQAAKEGGAPAKRKDIIVVTAVLVGIVLLCVVALATQLLNADKAREWEINEARGHYLQENAVADMSGDGPKANVRQTYFTNNDHLCVELVISNGTSTMIRITSLDVAVFDNAGTQIAGGKATLEDTVIIEVAGSTYYSFYIAPEHVQLEEGAELPLPLSYTVNIESVPVEAE